jgi:thymidylate synthase ThyX
MPYEVKIILDSVSPNGARLTTLTAKYPRFIHAEMLSHRVFSRNTASSRAIPMAKLRQQAIDDPVIPIHWGKNQPGMQAAEELDTIGRRRCEYEWLRSRAEAVFTHQRLEEIGLHKQVANRVLEPFLWTTCLISSTTWDNFRTLRHHSDAQPEMQKIACMIGDALDASKPVERSEHLPYWENEDEDRIYHYTSSPSLPTSRELVKTAKTRKQVSAARCARISYLNHEGARDVAKDLELADRLISSRHWSALEHPATACPGQHGNFRGWKSYRKEFAGESGERVASC